ncbi:MAG: GGDEF domain-containing protein [Lachnospiraceae bacterium]|nr:GGDEF domain-containing protein [Lachnospiraceae bacterium]
MYYAAIGVLALLILLIENQDILLNRHSTFDKPAWKAYRRFLIAVLVYYVTDIFWGIIESQKMAILLFADTSVYFIAMAAGILFWTQYVVTYLDEKRKLSTLLAHTGRLIAVIIAALSIINIFVPVLFVVDEQCVYKALPARYGVLAAQIILLLVISIYAFTLIIRHSTEKGERYRTVGMFGLIMAVFLTAQIWFTYLPFYGIAFMLGTCLLRAFVIGEEKEEYARQLLQVRSTASIDPLTGVRNRHAYLDEEEKIDQMIRDGQTPEVALVLLDINDLKKINDSQGHQAGDEYIKNACKIVCETFKHSPVFRLGGDEFIVLVQGDDYEVVDDLVQSIADHNAEAKENGGIVIACGMSKYEDEDNMSIVFEHADHDMYDNKNALKEGRAS